jgi:hypothetical protein
MTAEYIGDELVPKIIRVTKNCDRKFTVIRKDVSGNPINWDCDVFLNINLTPAVLISAAVSGSSADIRIESAIADKVKTGATLWQLYTSTPETPLSYENPLAVGYFERQDGKKPQ